MLGAMNSITSLIRRINGTNLLRLPKALRRSSHRLVRVPGFAQTRVGITSSWTGDWSVKLYGGPGAGYVGGWTAYVGFGRVQTSWTGRTFTGFAAGITRNGNFGVITSH